MATTRNVYVVSISGAKMSPNLNFKKAVFDMGVIFLVFKIKEEI
jgi:hypothetical protein